MRNRRRSEKGVALLASLIVSVAVFSYAAISFMSFVSEGATQVQYENNLQSLYDTEAGNTASMWEVINSGYAWDWHNNPSCKLSGSSVGGDLFYRLAGYNFRAKVYRAPDKIEIYVHGFQNTEANPRNSKYLVRVYSPSPMYQYAMFSARSLGFSNGYYDCKGGKIHTNGDVVFSPSGGGSPLLFNNVSEMSCAGSFRYAQRYTYPEPRIVDLLDGQADGMSPAPFYNNPYQTVTSGQALPNQIAGPFRRYYSGFDAFTGITYWYQDWKSYGSYVGSNWGSQGVVPLIWRGEETYFYGRQYASGSGYNTNEGTVGSYLRLDGTIGNAATPSSQLATVNNFYLDSSNSLVTNTSAPGKYYTGDVYFSPTVDKLGNPNNGSWYEIPGALPQAYPWSGKYTSSYSAASNSNPVSFYATELCTKNDAGCNLETSVTDPAILQNTSQNGWRYIKKDASGNICVGNGQYNQSNSTYVKAQDYNNYFGNIHPMASDQNNAFFTGLTYGSDYGSPTTYAMRSQSQTQGFQSYLGRLSDKNTEGVLKPGVEKKTPYLGMIFDSANGSSQYKVQANSSGLYIDSSNMDAVVTQLNQNVSGAPAAQKVTFFNWMTNQNVTLIDINVSQMRGVIDGYVQQNSNNASSSFSGIVYSKVPIRLSSAEILPGTNGGGKTAVFTVISEESVYLKGDYNLGANASEFYSPGFNSSVNATQWKISNIATKKKVYTLSNNFTDPQMVPDTAIYPEYPYVYVKVARSGGNITAYFSQEGNPAAGDGQWVDSTLMANTFSYNGTTYPLYYGAMDSSTRNWVNSTKKAKQDAWNTSITQGSKVPPNYVDKDTYTYNSLFITPYNSNVGERSLENWEYYNQTTGSYQYAKVKMQGAFLDFYDPTNANYTTAYRADATSEGGSDNTGGWNYWRGNPYHPGNSNYIYWYGKSLRYGSFPTISVTQAYDDRFPQAIPQNTAGVLGFTGTNFWRLISQAHFDARTAL